MGTPTFIGSPSTSPVTLMKPPIASENSKIFAHAPAHRPSLNQAWTRASYPGRGPKTAPEKRSGGDPTRAQARLGPRAVGPRLSEAGDGAVDQGGEAVSQIIIASHTGVRNRSASSQMPHSHELGPGTKTVLLQSPRLEVLHQHITGLQETPQDVLARQQTPQQRKHAVELGSSPVPLAGCSLPSMRPCCGSVLRNTQPWPLSPEASDSSIIPPNPLPLTQNIDLDRELELAAPPEDDVLCRPGEERWREAAGVVSHLRPLDLRHFSTQISQHLGAGGSSGHRSVRGHLLHRGFLWFL